MNLRSLATALLLISAVGVSTASAQVRPLPPARARRDSDVPVMEVVLFSSGVGPAEPPYFFQYFATFFFMNARPFFARYSSLGNMLRQMQVAPAISGRAAPKASIIRYPS